MKRLIGLIVGLGLLAAGCAGRGAHIIPGADGGSPSGTVGGSPSPKPSATGPVPSAMPSRSSRPGGGSLTYQVWFTSGEHLFVTKRTQGFTQAVGRAALDALLAGPSGAERGAGVGTVIPTGTKLLHLNIEDGVATVDLSGTYDDGGGSLSERMRLAQVVYTITQFSTVQGVNFRLDGKAVTTFSGEGIVLDRPQTRADYDDLLPAITVESPSIGQRVSSPVMVSGTANVFEATVSIWILDRNGKRIADTTTTASCGTGCRGDYAKKVSYSVTKDQPGTVEVFEASAKDGSPTNVVKIPVTLTA